MCETISIEQKILSEILRLEMMLGGLKRRDLVSRLALCLSLEWSQAAGERATEEDCRCYKLELLHIAANVSCHRIHHC